MRTKIITEVWEFYRDNCPGFKEPMRKQLRKVDKYLAKLESENAKLREFVRHMYACTQYLDWDCCDCDCPYNKSDCDFRSRMSELGMEVEE